MRKQEHLVNIVSFTETGGRLARQIKSILEQKFITELQEDRGQKVGGSVVQKWKTAEDSIFQECQKQENRQETDRKIVVMVQESQALTQPLKKWCKDAFVQSEVLIFVGAVGIAVRLIAPYVKDKFVDPAVVVVDEQGNFVIPILSGHVGGANQYSILIAKALGAAPVITTATDLNGKFAVDVFAAKNGLTILDRILAKKISAAVLRGERIGFFCEDDVLGKLPAELVWMEISQNKKIESSREKGKIENLKNFSTVQEKDSIISSDIIVAKEHMDLPNYYEIMKDIRYQIHVGVFLKEHDRQTLFLHPKTLVLGIGCKKGKSLVEIEDFVKRKFQEQELSWESVCAVASVEQKKQEQGLQQFCQKWQLPFHTFLPEELAEVPGVFAESKFVECTVGVGNVCERAAVRCATALAAQDKVHFPRLLLRKTSENGITLAIAKIDWSVKFE